MSEPSRKKSKVAAPQEIRAQILQAYQSGATSEDLKEIYNPILVEDVILIEDTPEETVNAFLDAATNGNVKMVKKMLKFTSPNLKDNDGWTALISASRFSNTNRNVETVKALLSDPRTNPNLSDNNGWTALMLASSNSNTDSNVETVKALLADPRTDPNLQNKYGSTALMLASQYINTTSNLETVQALLSDPRTDVNMVNNRGKTALDLCTEECKRIFQQRSFFSNLQNQGMRGFMKFQKPQEQLPVLPKDVWRLIIRRKIQSELCADLEDQTTLNELLNLAEFTMNVPREVVEEWRETKTKSEVCEIVSGLISIGAMYSENAMEFLRRRKEVGIAVGIFEQFEAKLKELGIEEFDYDDKGRKRIRNMNEILEELSMAQKELE